MANSKILTAEQEKTLRQPIEEYVGKIQKEIDELRKDGTAKVIMYQGRIENVKRDKTLSKGEKDSEIASCQKELEQAKAVEAQNKDQIAKLIGKAENYLKNNFDKYYNAVKASCIAEKEQALQEHQQRLAKIEKEHKETLAQEIIDGRRITRDDDLSFFLTCDLDELCKGADMIREKIIGDKVDLCSIINGRSGKCPEDCKYCAQSAHNHTNCEVYDFLPEEKILEACRMNEREGVDRFSIVTAGKALTGEEFEKAIHAYETMNRECKIDLCASMGFLSAEQLHRLHEAGVSSYHHNIETSKRNFPNICTTHTYDMKIETLKKVKAEGMYACSGGIIGMGETWEDRLDMAVSLAEVGVDSIPLNALMPIAGTPLEGLEHISEPDILRTVSFFRYINPEADIRLGAGRALLTNDGELAFKSGASATITGNMLTTVACATIRSDKEMLEGMGRNVTPEYMK